MRPATLFFALVILAASSGDSVAGWDADHSMFLLDGYCPVSLHESKSWVRGNTAYSASYDGAKYLFASEEAHDRFLANPEKYAVTYGGFDIVIADQEGVLQVGDRRHGVFYKQHVFLFTCEASLQAFWANPDRYASHYLLRRATH